MEAEQIKKYFLGKNVKIVLKNDYIYKGIIEVVDVSSIVINDSKIGEMFIDIESIKTMEPRGDSQ